jgi:hypothetical protein
MKISLWGIGRDIKILRFEFILKSLSEIVIRWYQNMQEGNVSKMKCLTWNLITEILNSYDLNFFHIINKNISLIFIS